MTTMRVTVASSAYTGLRAIRPTSENLAVLQQQMSSGKMSHTPTDDPHGAGEAMTRDDQCVTEADDVGNASSNSLIRPDSAIAWLSKARATDDANDSGAQTAQGAQTTAGTAMTSQLPGIENVDHTDRALKLATVNTAYRAALRTTASIGQVSLLDFLR